MSSRETMQCSKSVKPLQLDIWSGNNIGKIKKIIVLCIMHEQIVGIGSGPTEYFILCVFLSRCKVLLGGCYVR